MARAGPLQSFHGGGMALFKLTACGEEFIAEQEYHETFQFDAFQDSTVLVGDHVYEFDQAGKPGCIDFRTGKVVWEKETTPPTTSKSRACRPGRPSPSSRRRTTIHTGSSCGPLRWPPDPQPRRNGPNNAAGGTGGKNSPGPAESAAKP